MIIDVLRVALTRSFRPLRFINQPVAELDMGSESFGLYVHIPFCTTLCPFCPYNKVIYSSDIAKDYLQALISEIHMVGKLYRKRFITSVYFGGGTPALMLNGLENIVSALKENFDIHGNVGIELHPRDITEGCLRKLESIGFDMVSIGIQSFDKKCLSVLGREFIDGADKVRLAKNAGFKVIDVDLIFGMAGQKKEDLKNDLLTAFEKGATQVSAYPFIDFSYADNKIKPQGRKAKKELLQALEEVVSELGHQRTSVWTFGKRDTQKYSSITRDLYVGFGPSATTLAKNAFIINTFSVKEYIATVNRKRRPTALAMEFNLRTRALYWLFWNAYTLKLNNGAFRNLFQKELEEVFSLEVMLVRLLGLLKKTQGGYELTNRGAYWYHLVEQKYTHLYIDKTWRITREEPWPQEITLN